MRAIFAIVVALGLGISTLWTQTGAVRRDSQPQPPPPAQSSPSTTGRAQPQAPVGHRQPRAADVPPDTGTTVPPGQKELLLDPTRDLRICRDC
jgi:hypothetical protein